MSKEGKLRRGKAYHLMRNINQEYPAGIRSNPSKMADLNFYLDSIKPKEESEVKEKKPKKGE